MVTLDVVIFGLFSLGLVSFLVVGVTIQSWQKARERRQEIEELNKRVQALFDDGDWENK